MGTCFAAVAMCAGLATACERGDSEISKPEAEVAPEAKPEPRELRWLVKGLVEALHDPSAEVKLSILQALSGREFLGARLLPSDLPRSDVDALAPAVESAFDPPNDVSIDFLARIPAGARSTKKVLSFAASSGGFDHSTSDALQNAVEAFVHRHRSTAAEQLPFLVTIATSYGSVNEVLSWHDALVALVAHKAPLSPNEASKLFSLCKDEDLDGPECALTLRALQPSNASGIETDSLLALIDHPDRAARLETVVLLAQRGKLTLPANNSIPKELVAYAEELRRVNAAGTSLPTLLDLNLGDEAVARALARFVPETATAEEHLAVLRLAECDSPLGLIAQRIVTLCAPCSSAHGYYQDHAGDWSYPTLRSPRPIYPWLSASDAIAKIAEEKDGSEACEAWEQLARDKEMASAHVPELRQALQQVGPEAARGAMLFLASQRDTVSFVEEEVLALLDRPLVANAAAFYIDQIWPKRTTWIDEWATLAGRTPGVPAPQVILRKLRTQPSTGGKLVHIMQSIEGTLSDDVSSTLGLADDYTLWRAIRDGTLVRVAADYPDLANSFATTILAAARSRSDSEATKFAPFVLAQLDLTDPDLSQEMLTLQRANLTTDPQVRCWTAVFESAKNASGAPPKNVQDCIKGTRVELQAATIALASIPHFLEGYLATVRLLIEHSSNTRDDQTRIVLQRMFDQDPTLVAKLWSELNSADNQHQLQALLRHPDQLGDIGLAPIFWTGLLSYLRCST